MIEPRQIAPARWSVTYLRAVLLHAAMSGSEAGVAEPSWVRDATAAESPHQPIARLHPGLEALISGIRLAAEVRVAADLDLGAAYELEIGIEAAVVLGLQARARLGPGQGDDTLDDLGVDAVDQLLYCVVRRLAEQGNDIPGGAGHLKVAGGQLRAIHWPSGRWHARRTGSVVWLARQSLTADGATTESLPIPIADLRQVVRMLRECGDAEGNPSPHPP
jgi:hypothetical protein